MELVQIIYDILIFGGALLLLVIAVSYLIAKSKRNDLAISNNYYPGTVVANKNQVMLQQEQILARMNNAKKYPVVYQLDQRPNKEVKILRKPTVTKQEIMERIRQEENAFRKTNGNRKRYTIVNDEMKKTFKPNVINF